MDNARGLFGNLTIHGNKHTAEINRPQSSFYGPSLTLKLLSEKE